MAGRGVSSSATGSSMSTAGGGSPYMTATEVNELQRLLRRAKETGQVGRQFMQGSLALRLLWNRRHWWKKGPL